MSVASNLVCLTSFRDLLSFIYVLPLSQVDTTLGQHRTFGRERDSDDITIPIPQDLFSVNEVDLVAIVLLNVQPQRLRFSLNRELLFDPNRRGVQLHQSADDVPKQRGDHKLKFTIT